MKAPFGFLLVLAVTLAYPVCAQQRRIKHTPAPITSPAPQQRIALVIGNSAYQASPLKNPVNDARAMRQALADLGFTVIYRENASEDEMKVAIREFGAKIRNGGVGLFYFAGHGVQLYGRNYLIPVDAVIHSEADIEDQGVDANFVLRFMDSDRDDSANIVILDACRDNPFARSYRSSNNGLAKIDAPSGTLIAYATQPGGVASDGGNSGNGLYTQELLRFMRTPGLGIEEVFKRVRIAVREKTQRKQIPWEESSLTGNFVFNNTNTPAPTIAAVAPPVNPPMESASSVGSPTTPITYIRANPVHIWPVPHTVWNSKESYGPTNSGLVVRRGQHLRLFAAGQIRINSIRPALPPTATVDEYIRSLDVNLDSIVTPAGISEDDPEKPMPNEPTGALIAVIGDDNDNFIFIGMGSEFVAPRDGVLFLSINTRRLVQSGSFDVSIEVEKTSSTATNEVPAGSSIALPEDSDILLGIGDTDRSLTPSPYSLPPPPRTRYITRPEFSELSGKRKVFVNANDYSKGQILSKLREYPKLNIVETAKEAEFVINYSTFQDTQMTTEHGPYHDSVIPKKVWGGIMEITVRGDGYPLVVWSKEDTSGGMIKSGDAADKLTKRFISDLKKLRGEK